MQLGNGGPTGADCIHSTVLTLLYGGQKLFWLLKVVFFLCVCVLAFSDACLVVYLYGGGYNSQVPAGLIFL